MRFRLELRSMTLDDLVLV